MLHQIRLSDFRERHTAQGDAPCISTVLCRKDTRNRTLSAAGFADQRYKTARRECKVDALQNFPVFFIGKMHILQHNIQRSARQRPFSRLRLRQIKDFENLVTRRHAVHRDVEERSEQTQRQEKLTRQQHNAERAGHGEVSFQKFRYRHRHANRRAAVCYDVHHAR